MNGIPSDQDHQYDYASESYTLSGKIMLTSVATVFTVVLALFCVHLYTRWSFNRSRQRIYNARPGIRRSYLVFTPNLPSNTTCDLSRGLDSFALKSLPTFVYSTSTHHEVTQCAVCLSEFEENEKGRRLPKCNHCFHVDCIDMWFHSHSTCPLCRTPVRPEVPEAPIENDQVEIVVDSTVTEPGTSSALRQQSRISASEIVNMSIDVSRRNDSFKGLEEELKSPGNRIQALKKILSRERKASTQSLSCSSATEIDIEKGEEQAHAPPPTSENENNVSG